MAEPRFVHLHIHSDFSMVDGLQKIKPLVARVAEDKMVAMALTDQMNQSGLVRFYGDAHGKGIKPIIGVDFWVQSEELGDELFRLVGLAMDNAGQQNLIQLISKGFFCAYPRAPIPKLSMLESTTPTTAPFRRTLLGFPIRSKKLAILQVLLPRDIMICF